MLNKYKKINFEYFLATALVAVLFVHYAGVARKIYDDFFLTFFASVGTLPVLVSTYYSLKNKKISVDLLASIALVVSLLNKEWASAVFINLMLTSARILADYTDRKSQSAIRSLLKLRPEKVKVKADGKILEMPLGKVRPDDLIIIESGDRIPVDGKVISGLAEIDQSSLTGESLPVSKKIGDKVLSSTLNVSGSLIIKAEKVGKDTTFEKVIQLVEKSEINKIRIKTVADRFTAWYIVVMVIGALLLFFFSHDSRLVLAVMLVTCADDIAVAVPMAFSAAIGNAAKRGIIVKGGEFLEGLTKIKTMLLDKTGTLTSGKMRVSKIMPAHGYTAHETLELAVMADYFSEHPIAKSLVEYARHKSIKINPPKNFTEFPGRGSMATVGKNKIYCGRREFIEKNGHKFDREDEENYNELQKSGGTVLAVCRGRSLVGLIELQDEVRPDARQAIEKLRKYGVKNIVMLTGDNEKVAAKVSRELGIDQYHANLLPQDKLKYVKQYVTEKTGKVAMVGDGVNDAAALAISDIGIAMGAIGTDAAIEAADVALMKDNFFKIPEAIGMGRLVMKISRQDFALWAILNVIGLTLAFARVIGPEEAAAFNFITDFIPIFNSLRLFRYKLKPTI